MLKIIALILLSIVVTLLGITFFALIFEGIMALIEAFDKGDEED